MAWGRRGRGGWPALPQFACVVMLLARATACRRLWCEGGSSCGPLLSMSVATIHSACRSKHHHAAPGPP